MFLLAVEKIKRESALRLGQSRGFSVWGVFLPSGVGCKHDRDSYRTLSNSIEAHLALNLLAHLHSHLFYRYGQLYACILSRNLDGGIELALYKLMR